MNAEWLLNKLRGLHANQSGAVAFMVLCAILISMLMALVIYDTTPAARQKIEVQTAADTAAWSQSAVEARTMNMIAFANIGKRIIMGQTLFYSMLWVAWLEILAITVVALVVAIVACFFGVGCAFVDKLLITLTNIITIMANEATDLASWFAEILGRARDDVEAIDKYQVHFQTLTPWWSWGEAWRRGLRNGAYVSGWPVPTNVLSAAASIPGIGNLVTSSLTDELPIERYPDFGELCVRSLLPDLPIHLADYGVMTLLCGSQCTSDSPSGGIPRVALYAAAGVLATVQYAANCALEWGFGTGLMSLEFDHDWTPFQLKTPGNEADWYRMTSNIVFSYRPGRDMSGEFRDKYSYMSADYNKALGLLYEPDGFLGMARSEISYQNGDPDMWHPSWSARMRPIALPGEWSGYSGDFRMLSAFNDAVPYLALGATLGGALGPLTGGSFGGGSVMGTPDPFDLIKAEVAFDAMTDNFIEGVTR